MELKKNGINIEKWEIERKKIWKKDKVKKK